MCDGYIRARSNIPMKQTNCVLTGHRSGLAIKKKFLKYLRENQIPYVLEDTGSFRLGAAYCNFDHNYLNCSFGSLNTGYSSHLSSSIHFSDCYACFNRLVFINNRFVELSHAPKKHLLSKITHQILEATA